WRREADRERRHTAAYELSTRDSHEDSPSRRIDTRTIRRSAARDHCPSTGAAHQTPTTFHQPGGTRADPLAVLLRTARARAVPADSRATTRVIDGRWRHRAPG